MPKIGLITCREMPEPDPDRELLSELLAEHGADASWIAWEDDSIELADFDLCVLRSTWNYHLALDEFFAWLDRAAAVSRVVNPVPILRWNANKTYLAQLQESGVDVVPTSFLSPDRRGGLADVLATRGWQNDFVVKPVVSAGSHNTRRFGHADLDQAESHAARLIEDGGALVQPYMDSVETEGERALVQIGGEWSHSVRKSRRFSGDEEVISQPRAMTQEEQAFATRALASVDEPLLYARVDVLRDRAGRLCLAELELIEPSLFLLEWPPARAAFAAAILEW
jgi:O-ureido-D-serine cyclo-ligase